MRLYISLFFLLFTWTGFSQISPCTNFKTGEYKYANPKYAEWTVKRNDTIQVETSSKTGIKIYSLIEWKTDCQYKLTCNKVLNSDRKNIVGKVFIISITDTFIDRYKCISKSTDPTIKDYELEMIKMN